jgi:hypothetical protein
MLHDAKTMTPASACSAWATCRANLPRAWRVLEVRAAAHHGTRPASAFGLSVIRHGWFSTDSGIRLCMAMWGNGDRSAARTSTLAVPLGITGTTGATPGAGRDRRRARGPPQDASCRSASSASRSAPSRSPT